MSTEKRLAAVTEKLRDTGSMIAQVSALIAERDARIAALEHALRIYIHAHRSGNSVPVMIERDAIKLLEATK